MKICLITISVSKKYNSLAKKLLESVQKKFLKNYEPTIFLIGDDSSFISSKDLFYKIDLLPKPLITLLRYHYLIQIKEVLKNFDLLYYIDCDTEIIKPIESNDVFPASQDEYIAVKHFWEDGCKNFHLEKNQNSMAYVDKLKNYYQACFYGAYTEKFFELIEYGNEMVNKDLNNNIIAKWFDESHFNKYMNNKKVKTLSSYYAYPSFEPLNEFVKIIHHNAHTKL
jgi:hypothetical protein